MMPVGLSRDDSPAFKIRHESKVVYIPEQVMEKLQHCLIKASSKRRDRAYMILSSHSGKAAKEIR